MPVGARVGRSPGLRPVENSFPEPNPQTPGRQGSREAALAVRLGEQHGEAVGLRLQDLGARQDVGDPGQFLHRRRHPGLCGVVELG